MRSRMKKLLILFLILCTTISLYACASNDSEPAQSELGQVDESTEQADSIVSREDDNSLDSLPEPQTFSNEEDTADDYSSDSLEPPTDEIPDDTTDSSPIEDNSPKLIVMTLDWSASVFGKINTYITRINPETGEQQVDEPFYAEANAEFTYILPGAQIFTTRRHWFNNDYTRFAVTKCFTETNEYHAGWLNKDGSFFDVTEKLNLQSHGDFDDPVEYRAVGFSEDGQFVYTGGREYFFVTVPDVAMRNVSKGSPYPHANPDDSSELYNSLYSDTNITDWIDDNTFISYGRYSDGVYRSTIEKLDSGETIKYVPGSSRHHWNGVLNPDKNMIAFMSEPISGTGKPELFIIPVDGGNPTKINSSIELSNGRECEKGIPDNSLDNSYYTALIDWQ